MGKFIFPMSLIILDIGAAVSFKAYQRLTKSINFIVGVDLAQKPDMTCNNESVLRKEE